MSNKFLAPLYTGAGAITGGVVGFFAGGPAGVIAGAKQVLLFPYRG